MLMWPTSNVSVNPKEWTIYNQIFKTEIKFRETNESCTNVFWNSVPDNDLIVLSKGSFAFSKDIGLFYGLNVYVPPKLIFELKPQA